MSTFLQSIRIRVHDHVGRDNLIKRLSARFPVDIGQCSDLLLSSLLSTITHYPVLILFGPSRVNTCVSR